MADLDRDVRASRGLKAFAKGTRTDDNAARDGAADGADMLIAGFAAVLSVSLAAYGLWKLVEFFLD